jgi:hypothetical protein
MSQPTLGRRALIGRVAAGGAALAVGRTLLDAGPANSADLVTTPNPTVTGPVPVTSPLGDAAHGYPFFSTQYDIYSQGYVEEEFFVEGTANRYDVVNGQLTTAGVIDGGHAYRTRVVVRRPARAKDFNGTAFVEWYNVTLGFDVEADWYRVADHLVRAGYAWVGVSAQRIGVNYLKSWSPARYGTLDVTAGGTITNDALQFDIFSQVLQQLRSPQGTDLLGGLRVKRVIADGESQSASKLTQYHNAIHPFVGLVDAFILNGAPEPNIKTRTDLATPVFKIMTESDVANFGHAQNRQPDTDVLRSWEVAGTSHVDFDMIGDHLVPDGTGVNPVQWRDTGTFQDGSVCEFPTLPRSHYKYVFAAAIEHVSQWVRNGTLPPTAPRLLVESLSGGPRGAVLQRDDFGIVEGGIRMAWVDVPIAVNSSPNTPGFVCAVMGQYQPFDEATLATLYPSHGAYVSRVGRVTDQNLRDGYILRADATATRTEAARSSVGR